MTFVTFLPFVVSRGTLLSRRNQVAAPYNRIRSNIGASGSTHNPAEGDEFAMALRPGRVQQIHKREERGIDRSNEPFQIDKLTRRPGLIMVMREAFEPGYTHHLREIYPQWGIGVSTCVDNGTAVKHPRLRFDHYVDLVKVWEDQDYIYVEDMYVDVLLYEKSYYHVIDLEEFGEAIFDHQLSSAEAKRVMENTQKFVDSFKRSRLSYVVWKQKYGIHRKTL